MHCLIRVDTIRVKKDTQFLTNNLFTGFVVMGDFNMLCARHVSMKCILVREFLNDVTQFYIFCHNIDMGSWEMSIFT